MESWTSLFDLIQFGNVKDTHTRLGTEYEMRDITRMSDGTVRVWIRETDPDGVRKGWSRDGLIRKVPVN